jgi:integrase
VSESNSARKRGNSRPNVRRRGSTYTYYIYVTDVAGRRRQHSRGGFRTQRAAEEARIEALNALATGTYVKAERISLAGYLTEEWLPSRRPPMLEESTWHSYHRYIILHVIPHIGAVPLQKLTPVDLNGLYRRLLEQGRRRPVARRRRAPEVCARAEELRNAGETCEQVAEQLRAEFEAEATITKHAVAALLQRAAAAKKKTVELPAGLAPRTVRYIHTILHAALRDALRWNLVVRNVADAATPPSAAATRPPRAKAWTAEQLRALLGYAADSQYLPAWIFLATSGCRRGECLGLRWNDIDLEAGTAVMSRQVTALDHEVVVKELPKTKQAHLIRLDSGTVAMLRRLRVQQAESRLRLGPGYRDDDYVFCQFDGRPHHPERFSREFDRKQRYFNRDHPVHQLPEITLHGLRHTWATLALSAGIDIKIVSERLNHSSTHITREIYTHVTPPMQSDAAERVAGQIFGASPAP